MKLSLLLLLTGVAFATAGMPLINLESGLRLKDYDELSMMLGELLQNDDTKLNNVGWAFLDNIWNDMKAGAQAVGTFLSNAAQTVGKWISVAAQDVAKAAVAAGKFLWQALKAVGNVVVQSVMAIIHYCEKYPDKCVATALNVVKAIIAGVQLGIKLAG